MPARRGRRAVDDAADEQAVALVEPDGAAQAGGHVGGGQRHAEAQALEPPALGHRRDGVAQRLVGGAGEVEAVLEAVGVDADDAAGAVEHRRPGRARPARRGVLDGADDRPPARAAEPGLGRRHLAPRRPAPVATGGDGDDDVAGLDRLVGPGSGGDVAGVDVEHDEVAVDVAADDRPLHGPPVGEAHLGGLVAQVVGVGQHPARGDDEAAAPPVAADGDDRRAGVAADRADQIAQLLDRRSWPPPAVVTIELQVTLDSGMAMLVEQPPTRLDAAARRIGDRWSLRVVGALLDGDHTFGELASAVDGIAPTILTARLRALQRLALVTAVPYERRPLRMRYSLTEPGRRLGAAIASLAEWGADREGHGAGPGRTPRAARPLEDRPWCPTCDRLVADEAADDLIWC